MASIAKKLANSEVENTKINRFKFNKFIGKVMSFDEELLRIKSLERNLFKEAIKVPFLNHIPSSY